MAANISAWYPEVRGLILGVPPEVLLSTIVKAVRKFCEETHLWTETIEEDVPDAQAYVDLTHAAFDIIAVKNVKYKPAKADGTESDDDQFATINPCTEEDQDKVTSGTWEFQTITNPSSYFVDMDDPDTIRFLGTIDLGTDANGDAITTNIDGLRAKVVAMPLESATSVDDSFWAVTDHRDAITDMAASILFGKVGMPWGNLQMSQHYKSEFNFKCADVKMKRMSSNTYKTNRIRMRPFV